MVVDKSRGKFKQLKTIGVTTDGEKLERILKTNRVGLSADKVLSIAKTIRTNRIKLTISGQTVDRTMFLPESHNEIAFLFDDDFWENHLG